MDIAEELAALERMTVNQLRVRYAEAFGEATQGRHKQWLVKRIAWRLQAVVEGDLSERARGRAQELVRDADLRLSPPRVKVFPPPAVKPSRPPLCILLDERLPAAGTTITRHYKGQTYEVQVLVQGFEFQGEVFRSLSAVAKKITGCHCNGYAFFRLGGERGQP